LRLDRPRSARQWLIAAYVVFTAYAAIFAALSGGRDQVWAIWAVFGYGIGAVLLWRRRTWAALVISLALALVAPLIWISVAFPLEDGMNVINRSATLLIHHGSPYLPKDQVTGWIDYNPYLPVMALFGLPYAAGLHGFPGNSGVWLAVVTVIVLAAAFWVATPSVDTRRRLAALCAAIAIASPVIALNLAVITTDPPVLALMLLSLAFAAHPSEPGTALSSTTQPGALSASPVTTVAIATGAVPAGIALAVACVLKDTAWVAIPVMLAMFWSRDGLRAAVQFIIALLAAAVVLIAVLAPATLVRPAAMVAMIRDTVLFPLGLTKYKTPAESLLPGHLLATMGTAGHVLSVGLLLAVGLAVAVSLFIWPLRDVRAAAWRMAIGLTLMFALGPDVRFGYFIYPLGLAGWLALTSTGVAADLISNGHDLAEQGACQREPGLPDEARR
jgi:hypothetical protein